jgi:hypothetical protein
MTEETGVVAPAARKLCYACAHALDMRDRRCSLCGAPQPRLATGTIPPPLQR